MRTAILTALMIIPVGLLAGPNRLESPQEFMYGGEDFGPGDSYLGVDTRDVTADRLGDLKLKEEEGVEVTMVDQDAPAAKAGVREHDVILSVNGTAIESVEQLRRVIHEIPPGRTVKIALSRDGNPINVTTQLGDRAKEFNYAYTGKDFKFNMPEIHIPPVSIPDIDVPVSMVMVHSSMRSGLMVENITPQLGEYFGAPSGQGVLVRSVEKGSRAEKAGFRAGDVVLKINGQSVNDSGEFSRSLRRRGKSTADVEVIREKKRQNLTLTLPPSRETGFIRESKDWPVFDEDTTAQLREVGAQMEKLKPQMLEEAKRAEVMHLQKLIRSGKARADI